MENLVSAVQMEVPDVKHLVFAVLEFFDRQLQSPSLSTDAKESLEGKLL